MNPTKLKALLKDGKAKSFAEWVDDYGPRLVAMLQARNNLTRDDLEYIVERADKLKDARFKACIGTLIGWGDEERAELETFIAIAIEIMKRTPPSRLRDATLTIGIKVAIRENEEAQREATAAALEAAQRAVVSAGACIDTATDSRCHYLSHAGQVCDKCRRMHDGLPAARFVCCACGMRFSHHEHPNGGEGCCPGCGSTDTTTT